MTIKTRTKCSLCNSSDLHQVLKFPKTPLANELVSKDTPQDLFSLSLILCMLCGHLQLKEIISPHRLFRNYLYVSGTSSLFVRHFEKKL